MQLKIYLSSTYEDLKEHRDRVYRELMRLQHRVIAMEDYVAADVRPVDKCLADVRAADVYIGLFAWRYGYVPPDDNPDRKSITELELREAETHGKPCLVFILNDKALWPPTMMDAASGENERGDRISALRTRLRQERLAGMFESADDLAARVVTALYRLQMDSAPAAPAVAAPPPKRRGGRARGGRAKVREGYGSLWQNGARLRVRFLDGAPALRRRVARIIQVWSVYANAAFEPSEDADAELRVSFEGVGSWAYVGPQSLQIARDQPTAVFGWLTPTTPTDELEAVVLHEFGHVLGLMHEHNNPDAAIPWNKEAAYRDLAGPPNHWDRATVDNHLFTTWPKKQFPFPKPYDPSSIMAFPIPEAWTAPGHSIGRNVMLSSGDKEFIGRLYPYD